MSARRLVMAMVLAAVVLTGCDRSFPLNDPGVPGSGGFLRIGTISIIN